MYTILRKEVLASTTFLWEVVAPDIAGAAQPGQFVMVRLREGGERIPLTVADLDRKGGTIAMVVKVAGRSTLEMSRLAEGATFHDLIGPLGLPTPIAKKGHVVLVGGGIGIAPLYPILKGFKSCGTKVTVVVGFRSSAEIFWRERFQDLSDRLVLTTEDGSSDFKGTVIDGLKRILGEPFDSLTLAQDRPSINQVLAIGPIAMMQAVAELTRPLGIPTLASMNPIMVDGIGMCGSCRVNVGGKVLFACVDGPDMDAHKVDFEELKVRQRRFQTEEAASLRKYNEECALKERGLL